MSKSIYMLSLLGMIFLANAGSFAQYPALSSNPDTADYPYWIQMMQDPDAKYNSTVSAFNKYWQNRTVQKGDGWKVFKRWEYINESRVQPDGKLPAPAQVLEEYNKYRQTHPTLSPTGNWTLVGPLTLPSNNTGQPNGIGRINCVGFHPSNPNILYAGSASGGLWRTSDGGTTWSALTESMPTLGVSSVLVHPVTPDVIWLGTGDRDAGDAPGMGVYKSINGGMTWNASNTGMGNTAVGMMVMYPGNPDIILAACNAGVYKSTNGGANWSQKCSGIFKDIKFKPGNPSIMYAAKNGDFFRSTDAGDTWTQVVLPLTGSRIVIGVSPAQPDWVYIVQTNGPFTGLLKSTDSGQTFSTQSTTPNIMDYNCDGSGTSSQAWYDLCIAVDQSNADVLYVGGINIFKSTNGGVNWTITAHWVGSSWGYSCAASIHADQHSLDWSPLNGKLYSGNDGGIYCSSNNGSTWADLTSGIAISQVYKIGQSQTNQAICMNGYQDNGTSSDVGTSFTTVIGGDGMECAIDYTDANYRYGELYYGSIYRSSGGGYSGIKNNITESGGWVTPFMLHVSDPNTMFAGFKNVWRTNNVKVSSAGSVTWTAISTGETGNCTVLEQSPADPDILYVVRSSQLKRTSNANATSPVWTSCSLPGGYTPTDLAAHPADTNIVYATASSKVYKSTDRGVTWTNITGTLPNATVNCIAYDKNSNEGLYVGTRNGVFYRDANLSDWITFSSGLPVVDIRELEIYYGPDYSSSRIKAATYGRGQWQSDLIETGILNPTSFTATTVTTTEIDLSWTLNPLGNNVVLAYNTTASFGTPVNGTMYGSGTTIPGGGTVIYNGSMTSFNHTSLTPSTAYYYKIWSYNGSTQYSLGATANATTFCMLVNTYPWTEGFENAGTIPACWTQEYGTGSLLWKFQNGGSTGGSHPNSAHSGSNNACLYIANYTHPLTRLVSPPLNLTSISNPVLRFWHTQEIRSSYQDELRVYYKSSPTGSWILLATFTSSIPAWTQESIQLPNPSAAYFIAFEGKANYGYGVCLDDVAVTSNSLVWDGTGNWSDYSKWTPHYVPASFDDININTGICTINADANCNNITVQLGANLTVGPGKTLNVNGNIMLLP